MRGLVGMVVLALFFWPVAAPAPSAQPAQEIAVTIEVVADSSNSLRAQVRVPEGTPARALMEKLFQMEYIDAGRKFVVGIAGFKVSPREKKFWKLEVEGAASSVGIADIVLRHRSHLRWVITPY